MRVLVVVLVALLGCEGERVDSTTGADAATTDAGVCAMPAGNIVTDGDFTNAIGAWRPEDCKLELVAGRCGRKALRVYETTGYGRARHDYNLPFPKGTKFRLSAWFKKSTNTPSGIAPEVFMRSVRNDDAGVEQNDDYGTVGVLTSEWQLSERTFTLENEQEWFQIFAASMRSPAEGPDEFEVADISLVKVE